MSINQKANLSRKSCVVCGRPMVWRKKWALTWQGVKFCSDRCRREHKKPVPEGGVA